MIIPLSKDDAQKTADASLAVNLQVFALCSLLQGEVRVFDKENNKPFTIGLGLSPDLDLTDIPEVERDGKGNPKIFAYVDPKLYWIFNNPNHQFVKHTLALSLCAQVGFFYELVKNCDSRQPTPHPVLDFLRHIRNGAFHGNSFNIKSQTPHANWRGRTIDASTLNGKPVFFDFLAPGDAYLLISDVMPIVQAGNSNPVTLMSDESEA